MLLLYNLQPFSKFFTSHAVILYSWVICKLWETILLYWKFLVCYRENVFLEWTILSTDHNYFDLPSKFSCPLCTSKCWFALEPDKTCLRDVKNLLLLDHTCHSVIANVWVHFRQWPNFTGSYVLLRGRKNGAKQQRIQ